MDLLDMLLLFLCLAGLTALAVGYALRRRQVHAEHWLWKKQRMARARFLLSGGGALSTLSAVALLIT